MLRRMEDMKGRGQQTTGTEISSCQESQPTLGISEIVDG